jgi:hypothetical protein
VKNHRFTCAILSALMALVAVAPAISASAAPDLAFFVEVSPQRPIVGETIEVKALVCSGGSLADATSVTGEIPSTGTSLTFARAGTGTYVARYVVTNREVDDGRVEATATVAFNGVTRTAQGWTRTGLNFGTPGGPDWAFQTRIVNSQPAQDAPGPGDRVTVELRSFQNGVLTPSDTAQMELHQSLVRGPVLPGDPLNRTVVRDGVYQFSFDIPPGIQNSTAFEAWGHAGYFSSNGLNGFPVVVHPVPVTSAFFLTGPSTGRLRLLAGNASTGPIANATVRVTSYVNPGNEYFVPEERAADYTTNASGVLDVGIPLDLYGGTLGGTGVFVNTTWQNKTTSSLFVLQGSWYAIHENGGIESQILNTPYFHGPGQTAEFALRLLDNGTWGAPADVSYYLARSTGGLVGSGNATTDAGGNLLISVTVPLDWEESEWAHLAINLPDGRSTGWNYIRFQGGLPRFGPALSMRVSPADAGGTVVVRASVGGGRNTSGLQGSVGLVFGPSSSQAPTRFGSPTVFGAPLKVEGANLTARFSLPSWFAPGRYLVTLSASNRGAVDDPRAAYDIANATWIDVLPEGSVQDEADTNGTGPDGSSGSNQPTGVPSAEVAVPLIVGTAIAATAGTGIILRWRRR